MHQLKINFSTGNADCIVKDLGVFPTQKLVDHVASSRILVCTDKPFFWSLSQDVHNKCCIF